VTPAETQFVTTLVEILHRPSGDAFLIWRIRIVDHKDFPVHFVPYLKASNTDSGDRFGNSVVVAKYYWIHDRAWLFREISKA